MIKADVIFEKLSKHLNIFGSTFYRHNCMLNFVIFFLDHENSNAKFLSHTFQYSKILESPKKHNVMTSFGIRLIERLREQDIIGYYWILFTYF